MKLNHLSGLAVVSQFGIAQALAAAVLAALLVGCGGGGGGSDPGAGPAVPPPVPVPPLSAPAPVASTSAAALTFASTAAGATSAAQTVTLSNTGTAPLLVATIAASDAVFKITGGTCAVGTSVAAGASCTVTVAFAPTVAGAATGTLTFGHNASPNSSAVALSGDASAATNTDLVTSVTPATYAAGTVEKGAWDVLMHERQACGFGLLQQDTRLDAASAGHSYYLAQNSADLYIGLHGHGESPARNYFIGNAPWDRAAAKGFPPLSASVSVSEILSAQTVAYVAGGSARFTMNEAQGVASISSLMTSVYHLSGAMYSGRLGGIGVDHKFGSTVTGSVTSVIEAYRFGMLNAWIDSNPQRLGSASIATYPCAAATAAQASWIPAEESPNPFPEIVSTSVIYGTPIYFKADVGNVLVVSSAMVTKTSDGSALTLRQLTKANDPAAEVGDNEVFLVPTAALAAGSSYTVNASGTLNGAAFTKTFAFSTAR